MDLSKSGEITSIYKFGLDNLSETEYWFHWAEDVDVVRGFINGDTTERTYFTGVDYPRVTNNELALSGGSTDYPVVSYQLGVPKPTTPPLCIVGGTAEEEAIPETRTYTYTFVNSWGEESAPFSATPYPQSAVVDVTEGENVTLTLPTGVTGNYNITHKRIYRSTAGVYLFVDEIPLSQGTYVDTLDPDELVEEMASLTWEPPRDDLQGLTGMAGGFLAAFTGIDVYFSEPYRPFAWPLQYSQSVGYTIVGLGAIDTTLVVLTTARPFFLQGSSPDSMVMVEGDISQACVSKQSIVSLNGAVYYASPDGLVALAPGGSRVVTQGLFEKDQWQDLNPSSIRGFVSENRYVGFYESNAGKGGFIFDPATNSFTMHTMHATAGHNDLETDTLYLVVDNAIHKWDQGALLTYTWKSKVFTMPDLVSFTCYRVNAEAYPIDITVYKDGLVHHTHTVTSREIQRLPVGYGHDWEIELTGTGAVFSVQLGQSPRELANG